MFKRNPNKIKASVGENIFQIVAIIVITVLSISMIYPFLNSIALAFNEGYDSLKGGIYLWPRKATFENFRVVWVNNNLMQAAFVSVFRTVLGTALHVILSICCAFAMSKKAYPGRKIITTYLLIPTLITGGIVPYYILLRNIGLINNIWLFVLTGVYSFFNMVILRTYFEGLPQEIEEAARIDGCGHVRMLTQIIVPISLPVIATIGMYAAVAHWNDWFTGEFYMTKPDLKPLQTVLTNFLKSTSQATDSISSMTGQSASQQVSSTFTSESMKMAVLVIVTLPILATYPLLQKYFIKGVLIGSVKG
ncbi:MAG: carbohydrate ABC transporter permease [Oscillospiraceae bacterium]|nr:carbohydrate ABC transporter permease [Oscillospiraceae bacterium]